jgi:hypothetical protein
VPPACVRRSATRPQDGFYFGTRVEKRLGTEGEKIDRLCRFRCRRTELEDSPPVLPGKPLRRFREPDRDVKLNYSCHSSVLSVFFFRHKHSYLNVHATPIRTHNGRNRSI